VVDAPDAPALQIILEQFTPRQALTTGTIKDQDRARISTSSNHIEGTLTRSTAHFEFAKREGWLLWDFDDKAMPADVAQRIEELGGPLEALFHIWPEARDGEYLVRASSSGGIYAPGLPPTKNAGLHVFFLIKDVSQSKVILDTLMERAWAEGLGWIMLDVRGRMLKRGLVDVAVGTPERLIFEAPPVLHPPVAREAVPPVIHRGKALAAPVNGSDVTERARAAWDAETQAHQPQADVRKEQFIHDTATEQTKLNKKPYAENRARITRLVETSDGGLIDDDQWLQFSDGTWHRVGDILDNADQYDRQALPDPIEGMAGGRDKAYLLTLPRPGKPNDKPTLVSHIHGGKVVFRFSRFHSSSERLKLPKPAQLDDKRHSALESALRDASEADLLSVAVAVVHQLQNSVPVVYSVADVMADIEDNAGDRLSRAEMVALRDRLEWLQDKRRNAILARTSLCPRAVKHHDHIKVTSLDDVPTDDLAGVLMVKAPMGSGKTQLVGRPFVADAQKRGGTVMAIAHRVSLIAELSARLGLPNYQTVAEGDIEDKRGLAVCLPSTARGDIRDAMPAADYVFIDEVAQVLRFLADPQTCSTGEADNRAIYKRLIQIVRDARAVIAADADLDMRTLRFLEKCRPDERFKIVEMAAQRNGKTATVFADMAPVYDAIAVELEAGGKVWCACESEKRAAQIARLFERSGFSALCLTSKTKGNKAQAAFFNDAEGQSRLYDLVVSSPVISSGLSIEHKDSPHFTLGAYLGAGTATRPEDARQQLARVRYLDRFTIGIARTNATGGQNVTAQRHGAEDAAAIEGLDIEWTDFDSYTAGITAEDANARADFGAAVWFGLDAAGWDVVRGVMDDTTRAQARKTAKDAKQDYDAARMAALIAAEPMTTHLADLAVNVTDRTSDLETRLEAHRIRLALGKLDLTEADIRFWDNGRGKDKIDRFADLIGADVYVHTENGTLTQRRFRGARRKLFRQLFDGIDITAPLTREINETLLDRLMGKPETYAATGIVGDKYRARFKGKDDALQSVKRPKQPGREVRDILKRCGLVVRSTQARSVRKQPSLYNKRDDYLTKSDRQQVHTITPESLEYMRGILARRDTFDIDLAILARETPAPQEPTREAPADPPVVVFNIVTAEELDRRRAERASTRPEHRSKPPDVRRLDVVINGDKAGIYPADDFAWRRAERHAIQVRLRRFARLRRLVAEEHPGIKVFRISGSNSSAQPAPAPNPPPRPQRQLVVLTEAEQLNVMHRLGDPVSRYIVEGDEVRLIWTVEMQHRVQDVFDDWENLTPDDPEAWT